MDTQDFTNWPNISNDPVRAEQLRIASAIDLDEIKAVDGGAGDPAGGNGFRSGHWTREYKGQRYRFYASVPHEQDYAGQMRQVRVAAALHIAGLQSGYIRED